VLRKTAFDSPKLNRTHFTLADRREAFFDETMSPLWDTSPAAATF
jgi:hypothetical protein